MFSVIMLRIATGESSAEGETALIQPATIGATGDASNIRLSRVSSRSDRKDAMRPEVA